MERGSHRTSFTVTLRSVLETERRREKGERSLFGSHQQVGAYDSMSLLGEERDIEVHEQADRHACQFQICDQLRFVNRRKLFDNLPFNDHDVSTFRKDQAVYSCAS